MNINILQDEVNSLEKMGAFWGPFPSYNVITTQVHFKAIQAIFDGKLNN